MAAEEQYCTLRREQARTTEGVAGLLSEDKLPEGCRPCLARALQNEHLQRILSEAGMEGVVPDAPNSEYAIKMKDGEGVRRHVLVEPNDIAVNGTWLIFNCPQSKASITRLAKDVPIKGDYL
jgi:hypothetical protein